MQTPKRKNLRLKNYDYSQNGAYFITICVDSFKCLFGMVEEDRVILSWIGKIVRDEWLKTFELRNNLEIDEYVIMPNHFHAIFMINVTDDGCTFDNVGAHRMRPCNQDSGRMRCAPTIGDVVRGFKATVTSIVNSQSKKKIKLWQRNYYERIIRDEFELNKIRKYIVENPLKLRLDKYFNID
ncbi:MAG TPA: transposase [Rickettsiales bacterium]|nr:transposase [Rickettsiales bacterium]